MEINEGTEEVRKLVRKLAINNLACAYYHVTEYQSDLHRDDEGFKSYIRKTLSRSIGELIEKKEEVKIVEEESISSGGEKTINNQMKVYVLTEDELVDVVKNAIRNLV